MRWERQRLERSGDTDGAGTAEVGAPAGDPMLPGLALLGVPRLVRPPDFAGITFHEVQARSALNRVPPGSTMPFGWTVNPYRGCSHACVYCFARKSHSYLEFDTGQDFDSQIVVKVNIGQVLRRELRRPGWSREHVAMGTNTDPYQRAEGRHELMPAILTALAESDTPFSILTKGTVLARDLPLLERLAARVPIGIGVSLALLDPELQATLEPGTPGPQARLRLIRRIRDAGLACGVFLAPVLPHLTDSPAQLAELVAAAVDAGATGLTGIPLHLRPGAREWFFGWLDRVHPVLVPEYRRLYASGAYLEPGYRRVIDDRISRAAAGLHAPDGRQATPGPASPGTVEDLVTGVPGDPQAGFPLGSLPSVRRAAPSVAPVRPGPTQLALI